jgi:transcriptional regulator with XRE-family HTH domain
VTRLLELFPGQAPSDQATLAKWETGEAWITMQDLEMLAVVYGVPVGALFRAPGDAETPEMLRLAYEVIMHKDREAVRLWLSGGSVLREPTEPPTAGKKP